MTANNNTFSELPSGWEWTTLGDLVDFEYGKGLIEGKRDKSGTVPVYGSNGIVGYHSVALTNKPSLIVGRKGAIGEVHLAKVPCWPIDTTYFVYIPSGVDLVFMYYLMTSLHLNLLDRSTAIPGLNRNDAYALFVSLPPSPEQDRIVAKIDELFTRLDAGVEALQKIQVQLKRYRQSVLKSAFSGVLTAEWRKTHKDELEPVEVLLAKIKEERKKSGKYKELPPLDTSVLPELPEGWVWTRVGEIYDIIGGGTPSTGIADYWNGDTPWITSADIHGVNNITPRKFITRKGIEHSATNLVPENSLIVVTRVGLGKIAITNTAICFSQDSQALVGNVRLILPFYSLYYLSKAVQSFIFESRGTTISGVTKKQLSEVFFPLPSLIEQQKIIDEIECCFSVADEIENTIEQSLKQAERLRQSILKRAFEGKLVPQNPTDEPAEKLLERIKAERARTKQTAKQGRLA